jgi:MFS family permease
MLLGALVGRFAGTAGTSCVLTLELLRVTTDQHSSAATAVILAASTVPAILLSGVAGWITDTESVRRVVPWAGTCATVCAGLLPMLDALAWQALLVAAIGASSGTLGPSLVTAITRAAPAERIAATMANQQSAVAVGLPVGAAAGAVVFGARGLGVAICVAAGMFIAAAASSLAVAVPHEHRPAFPHGGQPRLAGVISPWVGLRVARLDKLLWTTTVCTLSMGLILGTITPLEVLLARDVVGMTPAQFGLAETFVFAGTMLGMQASRALRTDVRRAAAAVSAMGLAGALVITLGASNNATSFWSSVGFIGLATGLTSACFGALIATRTPPHVRGRVAASLTGLGGLASAVSLGIGGVVGALVPLRLTFVAAGGGAVIVAAVIAVRHTITSPAGARVQVPVAPDTID